MLFRSWLCFQSVRFKVIFVFFSSIPGSFSESQLDIFNDPAVRALERLLRVREQGGHAYPPLCHRRIVSCVPFPLRRRSGSGAEVATVPAANIAGESKDAVWETCGRENDAVFTVSESRGGENDAVLTVSESSRSGQAGEKGEFGLLEVIKSDFSSPLAHSKSLSNSSRVSSHVGCTGLALPSASACALAACTHGSCSAHSSAVVPLCMHVDDTCACINSCADTVSSRLVHRVPREGGVPKLGFPVWPKICALSQRWREG